MRARASLVAAAGFVGLLLWAPPVRADRYAILVGSNLGRGADAPLRFAESDAERMAAVLSELGRFEGERVHILRSPGAEQVEHAFVAVSAAIERAGDTHALLVFYYSGHADGASLHLGGTTLGVTRLADLLAQSRAAVRIGVLDACGTGALAVRGKGLEAGKPFMMTVPAELNAKGQVIVAAVSASESAQESDALQGSFFSTYLVSGLRGAADRAGAGRVTLEDAYRYAYGQTVRATLLSRSGAQHPSYDVNLSGQGDLVLTEPSRGRSRLVFRADEAGELALFTPTETLVAELALEQPGTALLALHPGEYEARKRGPGGLRVARFRLADGEERELREARMPRLDYVPLARKGVTPRIEVAAGWSTHLLASPSGVPVARVSVDLEGRAWVLSPRLTLGYGQWRGSVGEANPESVDVNEAVAAVGLRVARAFERGRLTLSVGGAAEILALYQNAFDRNVAARGALSAGAGAAWRVATDLAVTFALEPGLLVPRTTGGAVWRPFVLALFGARYDL